MSNTIVLTETNFQEQVPDSYGLVLVCAWAAWSSSAKQAFTWMEQVAADFAGRATIATVNIDEQADLSINLNIKAVPTFIYFKSGFELERHEGVLTKSMIEAQLARLV